MFRSDHIDAPGMITSQVLRAVQESQLVVADLTGHNPNVFYELAVRHAVEKPIIHVIEPRLSKIPFDVGGFRTIDFDLTDPDSIEAAVDALRKQAEKAESGQWGETPIKLAKIMQATKSDDPQLLLIKQAVEGISNVASRVARLEQSSFLTWPTHVSGRVVGAQEGSGLTVLGTSWNPENTLYSSLVIEPTGHSTELAKSIAAVAKAQKAAEEPKKSDAKEK
ncbi:MAG: hypothetical protein WAN18_24290 [Candidatus Sulfotelmatobacter sp.]